MYNEDFIQRSVFNIKRVMQSGSGFQKNGDVGVLYVSGCALKCSRSARLYKVGH
jgi:hypothetical protein